MLGAPTGDGRRERAFQRHAVLADGFEDARLHEVGAAAFELGPRGGFLPVNLNAGCFDDR